MGNARAAIFLPLSQDDWRDAVRSFVGNEKLEFFTAEVCITGRGARVVAKDYWRSGDRNAKDIAEGITEWVQLRRDSYNGQNLEVAISIWDERTMNVSTLNARESAEVKQEPARRGFRKIG